MYDGGMGARFRLACLAASVLAAASRREAPFLASAASGIPKAPDNSPIPLREWALSQARWRFDTWLPNRTNFEALEDAGAGVRGWLVNESQNFENCGRRAPSAITGRAATMSIEYAVEDARAVDVFNVIVDCDAVWPSGEQFARTQCDVLEKNVEKQAEGIRGIYGKTDILHPRFREATSWRVASANFSSEEFYYIETNDQNRELLDNYPPSPDQVEQDMCFYGLRIRTEGGRVFVTQTILFNPNYKIWLSVPYYQNSFESIVAWVNLVRQRSKSQNKKNFNATTVVLPDFMLDLPPCTRKAPDTSYRQLLLERAEEELRRTDLVELPPLHLTGGETLKLSRRLELCGGREITPALTPVWHGKVVLRDVLPVEVFMTIASKLHEPSWNTFLTSVSTFNTDAAWSRGLRSQYSFKRWDLASDFDRTVDEWQVAHQNSSTFAYLVATRSDLTNLTRFSERSDRYNDFNIVPTACNCLSAYEASEGPEAGTTLLHFSIHINPHADAENEALWDIVGQQFVYSFTEGVASVASRLHQLRNQSEIPNPGLLVDDGVLALLVPPPPNGRDPSAQLTELFRAPFESKARIFLKLDIPNAFNHSCLRKGTGAFERVAQEMLEILWWANAECPLWLKDVPESPWCGIVLETFLGGRAQDGIQLQQQAWALGFLQDEYRQMFCTLDPVPPVPDIASGLGEAIFLGVALLIMLTIFLCVCQSRARRRKMLAEVHLVSDGLDEARGAHTAGGQWATKLFGSNGLGFSSANGGDSHILFGSSMGADAVNAPRARS